MYFMPVSGGACGDDLLQTMGLRFQRKEFDRIECLGPRSPCVCNCHFEVDTPLFCSSIPYRPVGSSSRKNCNFQRWKEALDTQLVDMVASYPDSHNHAQCSHPRNVQLDNDYKSYLASETHDCQHPGCSYAASNFYHVIMEFGYSWLIQENYAIKFEQIYFNQVRNIEIYTQHRQFSIFINFYHITLIARDLFHRFSDQMGNQPSKKTYLNEEQRASPRKKDGLQIAEQSSPQSRWVESSNSIQDLKQLMKQQRQWPSIVRPYVRRIINKQQYQRYLRVILEQTLSQLSNSRNDTVMRDQQCNGQQHLHRVEQKRLGNSQKCQHQTQQYQAESSQNSLKQVKFDKKQWIDRSELTQLFYFYKKKLEMSYFVVTERGVIRHKSGGQMQFQLCLKQFQAIYTQQNPQKMISAVDCSEHQLQGLEKSQYQSVQQGIIPQLMLSQLYQYSSIKQKYINQMFLQLNVKAYNSLEQFVELLVQQFIVVEDQFNLLKFIVEKDVLDKSLVYLEQCCSSLQQKQRKKWFQEIRRLKENPTCHYVRMCRVFLYYKNAQAAQLIMCNIIQKGYHLSHQQLNFFFYVELYNVFLYSLNYSTLDLKKYHNQEYKQSDLTGSFISFSEQFQKLTINDIFHLFFLVRSYTEVQTIKKAFQNTFGVYEAQKGVKMFLKNLKNYALGEKSHLIVTIEALKNHLVDLDLDQKQDIQQLFLTKITKQQNNDVVDYEQHVLQIMATYKFSKLSSQLVKTLMKVSSILCKFQISIKISELCQFLLHQNKFKQLRINQQKNISISQSFQSQNIQKLQYLALVTVKKVITKYFNLGQSRQQVLFRLQDKHSNEQSFEYSTKQIQSLFILTQYLHANMFSLFIPLHQLHQLLFQHMLYFYKYDQVQTMLKKQNIERYGIEAQVVKMILLQNVREMLIKSQKDIPIISQDVKKQLDIVQHLLRQKRLYQIHNYQQISQKQNLSNLNYAQIQEIQELQSIKALYKLLVKLDFYSISLSQEQKQNVGVNLLYFLIQHYQHQIQVFDYDQLYRLITVVQGKGHSAIVGDGNQSKSQRNSNHNLPVVTNQYLKFKIDLAHCSYQKGKIKFGQLVLKRVLQYEPPWISSQIIKIIQKSPQDTSINQNFLNIAFQHCVKGQDLIFLLNVYKHKMQQKQKKGGPKITQLFQSTKKFIIIDESYVKDEKQYRNLVAEMTFNDESLKSKDYELFFTLVGTQPQRAFYLIYSKKLDLVKVQIILKQGMKLGILNILNVTKLFFKLLYFMVSAQKSKGQDRNKNMKASYIQFKSIQIDQVMNKIQTQNLFKPAQNNKTYQKTIPFILFKKMYRALKSLLILPLQFIQNYLDNPTMMSHQEDQGQLLFVFLFDQNYRQKHLIALKDQPMGKNDIKVYKQLCQINGLNIVDLVLFNLTNQLNTLESSKAQKILQQQNIQNILQKIVTWTQNNVTLIDEILSKLIQKIFSSRMLFTILNYLRQKQNPLLRQIITAQHMEILQSIKQIQVNTQLHGLITQHFLQKRIMFNPKNKLSQKHTKILKKQLKLRNVFLISKIMYFCYGMSTQVQKQVLKVFVKENQDLEDKELYQQLKNKLNQAQKL